MNSKVWQKRLRLLALTLITCLYQSCSYPDALLSSSADQTPTRISFSEITANGVKN